MASPHLKARFYNTRYTGTNADPFHFKGEDRMLDLPVCKPRPENAGKMHSVDVRRKLKCRTCSKLNQLFGEDNPAFHAAIAAIR
ncbi:hypothetical protein [Myxococcus phage Mx1]|nr:hypothetical protein [Myxococcus phage Mx1]